MASATVGTPELNTAASTVFSRLQQLEPARFKRVPSLAQARSFLDSASAEWKDAASAEIAARRAYDVATSASQSSLASLWARRLSTIERRKAAMETYFLTSELLKALNAQERSQLAAQALAG